MSNVENVSPQVLRSVVKELDALEKEPPDGVKLLLRDDNLTDVLALINGPAGTPYVGGVFRVRIALGRDFPASPPRAFFLTKIFHPNVSTGGEVCVNTLKKDWKPELGLTHVLLAIRCLLIAPNPESALNAEAGALLRDHYDDYFRRAKMLTDIHARPGGGAGHGAGDGAGDRAGDGTGGSRASDDEPSAKQRRAAPRAAADKRRILKRL